MEIGFIGLGNMGINMVANLIEHGYKIVVWNRSAEPREAARKMGAQVANSVKDFSTMLKGPRIIVTMVSAGEAVDQVLFANPENALVNILDAGDIVIEGANSFYKETILRAEKFAAKGIHLLDMGISGGIEGARHGASITVGGDENAFKIAEPIFKDLAKPEAYGYFGKSGAGHYVKMIHNAIEYGMMEVIAEGMGLLEQSAYKPDYNKLLNVWNNGSIIESKLLGYLKDIFSKAGNINLLDKEVGALGTGMWAAREALEKGIPFTAIAHAVFNRFESEGKGDFAFRIIQAMRAEFGAHTPKT